MQKRKSRLPKRPCILEQVNPCHFGNHYTDLGGNPFGTIWENNLLKRDPELFWFLLEGPWQVEDLRKFLARNPVVPGDTR